MRLSELSPRAYRRLTLLALLLLGAIIVTGAAVRLSGSGLGCRDWPNCEPGELIGVSNPNQAHRAAQPPLHRARLPRRDRRGARLAPPRPAARRPHDALVGARRRRGLPGRARRHRGEGEARAGQRDGSLPRVDRARGRRARAAPPRRATGATGADGAGRVRLDALPRARRLRAHDLGADRGHARHRGRSARRRRVGEAAVVADPRRRASARRVGRSAARQRASCSRGGCSTTARRAACSRGEHRSSLLGCAQAALGYIQYLNGIPVLLVGFHVAGAVLVFSAAMQLQLELTVPVRRGR